MLEVLRQLTVRQKESGPSQQEMVALRETAEQNEQCIYDLKVQLSQMSEGMLQLESMQTASHKALAELWKAVKALNTPPDGTCSLLGLTSQLNCDLNVLRQW